MNNYILFFFYYLDLNNQSFEAFVEEKEKREPKVIYSGNGERDSMLL